MQLAEGKTDLDAIPGACWRSSREKQRRRLEQRLIEFESLLGCGLLGNNVDSTAACIEIPGSSCLATAQA